MLATRVLLTVIVISAVGIILGISTTATIAQDHPHNAIARSLVTSVIQEPMLAFTNYLPVIRYECLPFSQSSPAPSFFWFTCFNSLEDVQNFHLSLLSNFYSTGRWIVGATADLKLIDGSYFLVLGNVKNRQIVSDAAPFTFGRWHRIEIMVTGQRQVQLYQDGLLVNVAELRDEVGIATSGGHPGLYGLSVDGAHVAPFVTGTLYNDNWTMAVWSSP